TLVTKDDAVSDDDLKLPADIKAAINRDSFWDSLVILCNMLHPFCGALDLMQRDKAYFHNILHAFGFFIQIFKELEISQFQTKIIKRLEKRWATWEQPLLLLSFGDIILWWSHNSGTAPELSRIACQLYGMCITTASVERLFSTMGFLHSLLRNKLK
ncbi:6646_t:CDS:2, partial [Racocetra persica]